MSSGLCIFCRYFRRKILRMGAPARTKTQFHGHTRYVFLIEALLYPCGQILSAEIPTKDKQVIIRMKNITNCSLKLKDKASMIVVNYFRC